MATVIVNELQAEFACEPGDEEIVAAQVAAIPGVSRVAVVKKSLLVADDADSGS